MKMLLDNKYVIFMIDQFLVLFYEIFYILIDEIKFKFNKKDKYLYVNEKLKK